MQNMDAFNKQEEKAEKLMMRESLNHIKQDMQQMVRKQEQMASKSCPPPPQVAYSIQLIWCIRGFWDILNFFFEVFSIFLAFFLNN